jgi:UDP-glucose 4-epimerase
LKARSSEAKDILEWARALPPVLPGTRMGFHMLSSAGGLFEGQRFVDGASQPQPRRAYGQAKLEQEELLERLRCDMCAHVYRPSSIYGFSGEGGRSGLVNTLIVNAKRHSVSRIFGGLDTVRDYVLAADIGEFVAKRILQPEIDSQTFLLASGKPASVSEIVRIASKVIGTPLYLKLDLQPSNASHITFRPSALPEDWRPTDLETGIRLVMRQLSGAFEAGVRRSASGSVAR